MSENPYQAPASTSTIEPAGDPAGNTFHEGLRAPIPSNAFESSYQNAWDTFGGNWGPLVGPAFLIMLLSSISQRLDTALYEVADGAGVILASLGLSVVFTVADTAIRMMLTTRWLGFIRFQPEYMVRATPTKRQLGQGMLLTIPWLLMFSGVAVTEFMDEESTLFLVATVGVLLLLGFAFAFNLVALPALTFIVDQDVTAVEALRRTTRMLIANPLGWFIYLILIPVVLLAGVLALCFGVIVSVAIIHGAFAVAYNRVAQPGNAYLTDTPPTTPTETPTRDEDQFTSSPGGSEPW